MLRFLQKVPEQVCVGVLCDATDIRVARVDHNFAGTAAGTVECDFVSLPQVCEFYYFFG